MKCEHGSSQTPYNDNVCHWLQQGTQCMLLRVLARRRRSAYKLALWFTDSTTASHMHGVMGVGRRTFSGWVVTNKAEKPTNECTIIITSFLFLLYSMMPPPICLEPFSGGT